MFQPHFGLTVASLGLRLPSHNMGDDPTEQVQEDLHHHASHGPGARWITAAATTAAVLAAFAAVAGALATSHLTQSTLIRIKANDDWNFYQAKSIKSSLLDAKIYSAQLSKVEPRKADIDKKAEYAREMPEIQASAKGLEHFATRHLETHETYEGAATLFHIAIAIVAISVVARRREFWYLSMVAGVIGIVFFSKALLHAPPRFDDEQAPAPKTSAGPAIPGGAAPNNLEKPAEHVPEASPASQH